MIMDRRRSWKRAWLARLLAVAGLLLGPVVPAVAGTPAPPEPVFAGTVAADPGVIFADGEYYAFTTGAGAPYLKAPTPAGPWQAMGPALTGTGGWALPAPIWAPDAVHVGGDRYVLYYSARVDGLAANQRCIGVAVSDVGPAGPYEPTDRPVSCPAGARRHDNGELINASDQPPTPNPGDGLIDASPILTEDGRRFVLYKTQRPNPLTTLRIVEVDASWTTAIAPSVELQRYEGQIENPAMVQRGGKFVLFASKFNYLSCDYATVWWRSNSPTRGFTAGPERSLLTTKKTGVCGPGGADPTPTATPGEWRLVLHGWVCPALSTTPCADVFPLPADKRRVIYAATLGWGDDGATPEVKRFLDPA
ncbi:family 43 glycosylhydrolase [Microlunatus parietis]|uniref:Glycosyl hydrolases family 43 n=1 Tax=Microlunatus parietis TaxID=682979 RepID=A0A7Y9L8R0_9ACTN|nr:family 43 glycosylhydrolase [Microlunatus parietis]NYE71024.1 hypothetical protein [Microlunatus parietis]